MSRSWIIKLALALVIVFTVVAGIVNYVSTLPQPPIYLYIPWRESDIINIFVDVVNNYIASKGGRVNVSVEWPRSPQVDARLLVFAKMVEEYIKPMIVGRTPSPAIAFITTCGRELASYVYAGVWGGDDFVKFDGDLNRRNTIPVLACSLTGVLTDLGQKIDNTFALPIAVYQSNLIFMNRRVASKLSIDLPRDLDSFLKICDTALQSNVTCITLPGYDPRVTNAYDLGPVLLWENVVLSIGGVEKYSQLYYGDLQSNDIAIVRSVQILSNISKYIQPSWRRTTRSDAIDMLVKGEALFYVGGSWDLRIFKTRYPNITLCPESEVSEKCDIVVSNFPGTSGVVSVVVYGVGVVNNPSASAAIDLAKYLVREDVQIALVNKLFIVSPYLTEDQYSDPVLRWIARNIKTSKSVVLSLAMGGMFSISGIDQVGAIYGIIQNSLDYIQKRTSRLDYSSHLITLSNYIKGHRDRWLSMNIVVGLSNNYLFAYTPSWFKH